ncbi:MAG TPA: hypothetical protein VG248_02690 [Caulobacteraceae bacterium]|jgi:hypothetical protein|nr:hypothetical protein [Caulobacteraceae bacterium]
MFNRLVMVVSVFACAAAGVHAEDILSSGSEATAAADANAGPASTAPADGPGQDGGGAARALPTPADSFLDRWRRRADAAKASQPHWMTPLATVTPRLEQEFRYDQFGEHLGNGGHMDVYDGGKGLELIPTDSNEILINLPPYQERYRVKPGKGFNDWTFLVVKQRFLSANEDHGNYIVTGFLGFQAPTGVALFTNHAWVITPTLAAGKGWGRFDVQATLGVPIPVTNEAGVGVQVTNNVAFQYHLGKLFWPELEFNTTWWVDGPREGKVQTFVTPGLIIGRIPLVNGTKLIIGAGYQIAVAPRQVLKPVLTPTYQNAYLISTRVSF